MALKHLVQIAIVVASLVSTLQGQFRIEDGRLALYLYSSNANSYENTSSWCSNLGGVIPSVHNQADVDFIKNRVFESSAEGASVWLSGNIDSSRRITWSDGTSDFGSIVQDKNCYQHPNYPRHYERLSCCKTVLTTSVDTSGVGHLIGQECSQNNVHQLCVIRQTKQQSASLVKSFAEESIMSIILSANQTEERLEAWKNTTASKINQTVDQLTQHVTKAKDSIDSHMKSIEEQIEKNLTTFKNNFRSVMNDSANNVAAKLITDVNDHLTSSLAAMNGLKSELHRSQELFTQEIRLQLEASRKEVEGKINEIRMKMLHHKEVDDGKHDKTNTFVYLILFILCIILLGFAFKFVKRFLILEKRFEKSIKQEDRVELDDFQDKA